jgi:hypothetical protein
LPADEAEAGIVVVKVTVVLPSSPGGGKPVLPLFRMQ